MKKIWEEENHRTYRIFLQIHRCATIEQSKKYWNDLRRNWFAKQYFARLPQFTSGRGALMKEAVTIRWIEYQSQFAVLRNLEQQFNFTKDLYFIVIAPWTWCWPWPWWRPLSFVWLCLRIEIFHALPLSILSMFHVPMSMSYCSLITLKKKNPRGLASFCYVALVNSSKVWKFGTRMADAVVVAWQCQWQWWWQV